MFYIISPLPFLFFRPRIPWKQTDNTAVSRPSRVFHAIRQLSGQRCTHFPSSSFWICDTCGHHCCPMVFRDMPNKHLEGDQKMGQNARTKVPLGHWKPALANPTNCWHGLLENSWKTLKNHELSLMNVNPWFLWFLWLSGGWLKEENRLNPQQLNNTFTYVGPPLFVCC